MSERLRALGRAGLTLALAVTLAACSAAPARADAPDPRLDQALGALEALQGQVDRLQTELRDARRRLAAVEQRTGVTPLQPRAVTPWGGDDRLTLPAKLRRVDALGARPQTASPRQSTPYVVAFWATWCKPCTTPEELDRLRWLGRELRAEGLGFLSVAIDDLSKVRSDRRAPTWYYPLWQGDDAHVDALPRAFIQKAGMGLPLFAVADGQGRLRFTRAQALDDAAVVELVTAARSLN